MSSVNIFLFQASKKSPDKIARDDFLADVIIIFKYILSLDQMGIDISHCSLVIGLH